MTTDKQKRAIAFCNQMCHEKFEGDLDNFKEVSDYLSKHLNEAKKATPKKVVLASSGPFNYSRYMDEGLDPYIEDALRNDLFT